MLRVKKKMKTLFQNVNRFNNKLKTICLLSDNRLPLLN